MTTKKQEKNRYKIDKEETKKLNEQLKKLRNKEAEREQKTTEEILNQEVTPEEKKELIKKLKDPDLLINIKKELDKDHIGDDKAKLFLFSNCLTSRLRPDYRFSSALTGDTAEGKTNIWKTISRHLPQEWYIDLTRLTASTIEDDIHPFNLIYFGEKNANKGLFEQIKQLVEDGMDILKKDVRQDFKTTRRETQPRKVGIFSTTENINERELSSRYAIVSVHGNPSKYNLVNLDTLNTASNLDLEIEKYERKNKPTWIEKSLRQLKYYDFITIPYAPILEIDSSKSRTQRDIKRFLNLIRSLTWLYQFKRPSFQYKDYKILVSTAEDLYNSMQIGEEIFSQSLSELEPRLQEVIDIYKQLKNKQEKLLDIDLEELDSDLDWVDRSIIQKELGIDSVNTIKQRIKKLCDMNIMSYQYNKSKNRCYIAFKKFKNTDSPVNLPINNLLITYQKNQIYEIIKTNYNTILEKTLTGALIGDFKENDFYTNLLKDDFLHIEPPVKNHLSKTVFSHIKEQLDREMPEKSKKMTGETDRSRKIPDQIKKINNAKNRIEQDRKAGYKITEDYLNSNFSKPFVDHLRNVLMFFNPKEKEFFWK